jgi:hypothetical protein
MRKIKFIASADVHDLTMLILQRTNFSGQSVTDLTDQISNTYLDVYNQLVEKYAAQQEQERAETIVPIGLEVQQVQ